MKKPNALARIRDRIHIALDRRARDRKRNPRAVATERVILRTVRRLPKRRGGSLAITASALARTCDVSSREAQDALTVLVSRQLVESYTFNGRRVFVPARRRPTGIYRVPSNKA